ncbi:hypothetical protein RQM59_01040 [Flavobacteriaceae bacterium S356]|uniref:DUF1330 domain-containing protein n=1 Tax=Asprobacillus argus TaxID=3076534 RepID=A0ABU3LBP3_9FLAO|nr:hypothetical protein [Flavobacteriaceae bacterium S356]
MSENDQNVNHMVLEKLKSFPKDQPVFMLNYLNYKELVETTGKTGQETYSDYMKAAMPFFEHIDAEIVFKGKPMGTILGLPEEKLWDEVLIVKYASKYEFFKLLQLKEYPRELRASALADSRLIFCK